MKQRGSRKQLQRETKKNKWGGGGLKGRQGDRGRGVVGGGEGALQCRAGASNVFPLVRGTFEVCV